MGVRDKDDLKRSGTMAVCGGNSSGGTSSWDTSYYRRDLDMYLGCEFCYCILRLASEAANSETSEEEIHMRVRLETGMRTGQLGG